jgi:hypothetical protein
MAKKLKIDFKKVLAEKGEKIGLYAAGGVLVLLLICGGLMASKAASPGGIVKDMDAKVSTVQQRTVNGPSEPAPIDPVIYKGATVAKIPFTDYPTPNNFFNIAADEQLKRMNPRILTITDAQAQFIRGSLAALDIIDDPSEGTLIGVLAKKAPIKNDLRRIRQFDSKNGRRPQPPGGPVAGNVPPPPPPAPGGGRAMGGMGGPTGGPRGAGGPGGQQNARSNEVEVQYMKLDAKDLDSAKLAETIIPKRMVVVNGAVPYKKQLESYAAALHARTPAELAQNDLPLYHGYNVQRQVWSADGKQMLSEGWVDLSMDETCGPLYGRLFEFEPDTYTGDPSLASFFARLIPDQSTQLVLPRPKLVRGQYEPLNLPEVDLALKALKESGGNASQLKNNIQQKLGTKSPFDVTGQSNSGQVISGGGGGSGSGSDAIVGPPGKPGGRNMLGGQGARPGPGAADAVPEDCWLMRFIDVTVEPGFVYRYRVQLKVLNPNFKRNIRELSMPKFAEEEELLSPWFELKDSVAVPRDEFLYAAAKDEKNRRVTEKLVQESPDVTFLQFQRWADFVRPTGYTRDEPIGDWLVADLKVHRGQFIGENTKIKLPLWSMVANTFLFRDPLGTRPIGSMFAQRPRSEGMWPVEFTPLPQAILVDFEGGSGTYQANRKQVIDQSEVNMLVLGDDGKLFMRRSQVDLNDPERKKREETWRKWLEIVQADTDKFRNDAAQNQNPAGGPAGPAGPGRPGGGGNPGG